MCRVFIVGYRNACACCNGEVIRNTNFGGRSHDETFGRIGALYATVKNCYKSQKFKTPKPGKSLWTITDHHERVSCIQKETLWGDPLVIVKLYVYFPNSQYIEARLPLNVVVVRTKCIRCSCDRYRWGLLFVCLDSYKFQPTIMPKQTIQNIFAYHVSNTVVTVCITLP